jgi:formate hydrogenlyase transcriptional activator
MPPLTVCLGTLWTFKDSLSTTIPVLWSIPPMGNHSADHPVSGDALRLHAEERLRAQRSASPPTHSVEETWRLFHELQVHQVELEMQNEQLRQARSELESSRDKFAELYDFAPVGYFTFDAQGRISAVNLMGAQLLGVERRQLCNIPFAGFIADAAGRETFARHRTAVLQGEGVQRCEIRLKGKDGSIIHGQLQSVPADSVGERDGSVLSSVVDGTLGRQLGDELQKAHDDLEQIVKERTKELTRAIAQLTLEVAVRKQAEQSLQAMKDRLQAENVYLQHEFDRQFNFGEIIGSSKALLQVFLQVEQVAPMNATVLLLGETGTGKGVVARAIHNRSSRKGRPMIIVNCAALPAALIESELFGREKGAFTGAHERQIGRFELANGGTIFLDEIGELPLELQGKLLRVIQDGEFERLGSPRSLKTDVRIIAASNRNLERDIESGGFRRDLFYRLNVFPITLPTLRERREDIPLLVNYFVAKFNQKAGKKIERVPKETMDALLGYHWPGNVRELESVIERAVITSPGTSLRVMDRFDSFRQPSEAAGGSALAELEQQHIFQTLVKTGWRINGTKGAAVLLGLNPSTLRARIRKLGIVRPD